MIASETATRYGIDNTPDPDQEANLSGTAWFLETLRSRLRVHFAKALYVVVTSGFRSIELNARVGSTNRSYHTFGLAADIRVPGISIDQLAKFIELHMQDCGYDKVISEHNSWVHIQMPKLRNEPRLESYTAIRVEDADGRSKTVYERGLREVA